MGAGIRIRTHVQLLSFSRGSFQRRRSYDYVGGRAAHQHLFRFEMVFRPPALRGGTFRCGRTFHVRQSACRYRACRRIFLDFLRHEVCVRHKKKRAVRSARVFIHVLSRRHGIFFSRCVARHFSLCRADAALKEKTNGKRGKSRKNTDDFRRDAADALRRGRLHGKTVPRPAKRRRLRGGRGYFRRRGGNDFRRGNGKNPQRNTKFRRFFFSLLYTQNPERRKAGYRAFSVPVVAIPRQKPFRLFVAAADAETYAVQNRVHRA